MTTDTNPEDTASADPTDEDRSLLANIVVTVVTTTGSVVGGMLGKAAAAKACDSAFEYLDGRNSPDEEPTT